MAQPDSEPFFPQKPKLVSTPQLIRIFSDDPKLLADLLTWLGEQEQREGTSTTIQLGDRP